MMGGSLPTAATFPYNHLISNLVYWLLLSVPRCNYLPQQLLFIFNHIQFNLFPLRLGSSLGSSSSNP